jgi:hypothetical protein
VNHRYRYLLLPALVALLALAGVELFRSRPYTAQSVEDDINYCVACHTSGPLLQVLAVEEEPEEELSQGPG